MVIILTGVAGSGKTTVGRALAEQLGWMFYDGDVLHAPEHIEKISRGLPLTDEDRLPWLAKLRQVVVEWVRQEQHVVLACSLLKQTYRDAVLSGQGNRTRLVYLQASSLLLRHRLANRIGHFMGVGLLESQLAILEEPTDALTLDASERPDVLVEQIRTAFRL